jgi:hypothetical protein
MLALFISYSMFGILISFSDLLRPSLLEMRFLADSSYEKTVMYVNFLFLINFFPCIKTNF